MHDVLQIVLHRLLHDDLHGVHTTVDVARSVKLAKGKTAATIGYAMPKATKGARIWRGELSATVELAVK